MIMVTNTTQVQLGTPYLPAGYIAEGSKTGGDGDMAMVAMVMGGGGESDRVCYGGDREMAMGIAMTMVRMAMVWRWR